MMKRLAWSPRSFCGGSRLDSSPPAHPSGRGENVIHTFLVQLGAIPPGVLPAHAQEDRLVGPEGVGPEGRAVLHLPSEPLSAYIVEAELSWTPFADVTSRGRPRTDDVSGLDHKDHPGITALLDSRPVCLLFSSQSPDAPM